MCACGVEGNHLARIENFSAHALNCSHKKTGALVCLVAHTFGKYSQALNQILFNITVHGLRKTDNYIMEAQTRWTTHLPSAKMCSFEEFNIAV